MIPLNRPIVETPTKYVATAYSPSYGTVKIQVTHSHEYGGHHHLGTDGLHDHEQASSDQGYDENSPVPDGGASHSHEVFVGGHQLFFFDLKFKVVLLEAGPDQYSDPKDLLAPPDPGLSLIFRPPII